MPPTIQSVLSSWSIGLWPLLGLGLSALLYTAISLMQKIEESLNFIWHIRRRGPPDYPARSRSLQSSPPTPWRRLP